MSVKLNEISRFINHNNSVIKYNINIVPEFEQNQTIPERQCDPNMMEEVIVDDSKSNILKYNEDEIIDLPAFIDDFFDLNEYYSYGVNKENTFIYSLLYCNPFLLNLLV